MLRDFARHPISYLSRFRGGFARKDMQAPADAADHYARQRQARLDELAAAGKCLARPGKHGNLRYWPAERGSRVLIEHRRRQRVRAIPVSA